MHAVIGIQSSLRSIETFARNVGELKRGSQQNEEMVSAIKGLTATAKLLKEKLQSSKTKGATKLSSDLPLWIKVYVAS